MMNDLAKRSRKQQRRSREIEDMLALHAPAAQSFNRCSGLATLGTEGRIQPYHARPTLGACPSPFALENRSVTYDTRDWEQEIEDLIEQSAFGENAKGKLSIQILLISNRGNYE